MTSTSPPNLEIGPFRLSHMLGSGGMGEVWLGEHVEHGARVALKVMTLAHARHDDFFEKFAREVEVMARLNHPNAAMVLDIGALHEDVGEFLAGTPYIVMEYIDGCTLKEAIGHLRWPRVRRILLELLDVLSHAHAIGVIHRDLKPQNILLEGGIDKFRAVKLVDFGIAHLLDLPSPSEASVDLKPGQVGITGTPKFMSPEQIRMLDHMQGPWTDLYSFGCLAWYIFSGQAPFMGTHMSVLYQHMSDDPPALEPIFSCPPEIEAWLRRLLSKHPAERFQRAADAAHAIRLMPDAMPDDLASIQSSETAELDALTFSSMENTLVIPSLIEAIQGDAEERSVEGAPGNPAPGAPPLPPTWHSLAKQPEMKLIGAGLGLWGLRTLPVVGRIAERTLLWETLRSVHDLGQARAVMFRGLSGMGKSKLVEWLAIRAHEVGAAHVLRASHGPLGGPLDGLGPMIGRHLRCQGLVRQDIFERVLAHHEDLGLAQEEAERDAAAITELIEPRRVLGEQTGPAHRFSSATERYAVMATFLERLCAERTVLLCLDDVQWSLDVLGFVRYLLVQGTRNLPILILMTVGDEASARLPHIHHVFEQLGQLEAFSSRELGPLEESHQRELLENLLSLKPEVAERVLEKTGGTPLFAIQLVDDWIARGRLEVTPQGFDLEPGAERQIPQDLTELIHQRLTYLLSEQPGDTLIALELAATLGRTVPDVEWDKMCERSHITRSEDLVPTMIKANLATREVDGWRFAHESILDVLITSATNNNRRQSHHVRAARMVSELYPMSERGVAMRHAEHLMAAKRWDEALESLMAALYIAVDFGDYGRIDPIVKAYERCMHQLGLPEEHPHRIKHWCISSAKMRIAGQHEEARELLDEAILIAREHAWEAELGLALRFKGLLLSALGSHSEALLALEEASTLFERVGQLEYLARTLGARGQCLSWLNRVDDAIAVHRRALALHEQLANDILTGRAHEHLASCLAQIGDHTSALQHARSSLAIASEQGNSRLEASTRNELGLIHRRRGEFDMAREQFLRAAQLYERFSEINFLVIHHNLGVNALLQDDWSSARAHLEPSHEGLRDMGQGWILPEVTTALLVLNAATHKWDAWQENLDELERSTHSETTDPILAKLTMRAAELALAADERQRARQCLYLALAQYQRLGSDLHVSEILDILDEMID